jgi:4-hydroxy-2-oxoheptanedioate aldolase
MIETADAMKNLDDILSTPGLDAIYIGPADLSQGLGGPPGADFTEPPVTEAIERILAGCRQHGVIAGIHTGSVQYATRMIDKGFQFVTVLSDVRLMTLKAAEVVTAVKGHKSSQGQSGPY